MDIVFNGSCEAALNTWAYRNGYWKRKTYASDARRLALWPFSKDSAWNTPIGRKAEFGGIDHEISRSIRSEPMNFNYINWSISVVEASYDDPIVTVQLSNGSTAILNLPVNATPSGGTDAHLTVVSPDGHSSHDFIGFSRTLEGVNAYGCVSGDLQDLRGTGVAGFDSTGNSCKLYGGTRAYGGNTQAGLIRSWELNAGYIGHAIALAFTQRQLSSSKIVWPASCSDYTWDVNTGPIAYGQLVAIPSSVDVTSLGLSSYGTVVARALQRFGGYAVDRSSNGVIYGDGEITEKIATKISRDMSAIRDQLRPVLNNSFSTPGGGGKPASSVFIPPIGYDSDRALICGKIKTGGSWFCNYVGLIPGKPGVWGRLRHNGDQQWLPTLPANSGITLYWQLPIGEDGALVWSSDGVTPAPDYVGNIAQIM